MIEYGGSTGTRHCRRLVREQQAEVTTSNIIHLHPMEHVEFGGQRTDHIPQKSNNHRHNVDNTFYFNQRGRYSVYEESVYCKGRRTSHKGGSIDNSKGRVVVLYYRGSVLYSRGSALYRRGSIAYYKRIELRGSAEQRRGQGNIEYFRQGGVQHRA